MIMIPEISNKIQGGGRGYFKAILLLLALVIVGRGALVRCDCQISLEPFEQGTTTAKVGTLIPKGATSSKNIKGYAPSNIERYFLENGRELGLDSDPRPSTGCTAWKDPNSPIAAELKAFRKSLKAYKKALATFRTNSTLKDLRKDIAARGDYSVCDSLELHRNGLKGLFILDTLTETSHGLLEPLYPPMRDPNMCFDRRATLSMDYLIHDFAAYCRQLTPSSRVILVDMGASLDFHGGSQQPAVYLTNMYSKFGFHFDHIYAYEITPTDPTRMVKSLPVSILPAYHWFNVGVDPNPNSKQNPWRMLRQEYDENDFVIVKLDIDTPHIEMAMVQQLLNSPKLLKLVDVFYFEHHVHLKELASSWRHGAEGSVLSSLELFAALREKGVDAHFWV